MRKIKLTIAFLLAMLCLTAIAQFRNTNGVYQYQSTLQNADVFVTGRPSANTNYNYAASNLLNLITNVASASSAVAVSSATPTNILILRSNSTALSFSNDVRMAVSNMVAWDTLVIPPGRYYISNSILAPPANTVIQGSGMRGTEILGWTVGPMFKPNNNVVLNDVFIGWDWLQLQLATVDDNGDGIQCGIGLPNILQGNQAGWPGYADLAVTNFIANNVWVQGQVDTITPGTNWNYNWTFNNCIIEFAWDATCPGGARTNWITYNGCDFRYLPGVFTNSSGQVIAPNPPRLTRQGTSVNADNYIFNNCSAQIIGSAVGALWPPSTASAYGGNYIVIPTVTPYSFEPSDLKAGFVSVNGKSFTRGDVIAANPITSRTSIIVSNNTAAARSTYYSYSSFTDPIPVEGSLYFDPDNTLADPYSGGWKFTDYQVYAPAGFVGPHIGNGSGLTNIPPTTGISGWPANSSGYLNNNGSGTLSWGTPSGSLPADPSVNSVLTNKSGGPSGWFPIASLPAGSGGTNLWLQKDASNWTNALNASIIWSSASPSSQSLTLGTDDYINNGAQRWRASAGLEVGGGTYAWQGTGTQGGLSEGDIVVRNMIASSNNVSGGISAGSITATTMNIAQANVTNLVSAGSATNGYLFAHSNGVVLATREILATNVVTPVFRLYTQELVTTGNVTNYTIDFATTNLQTINATGNVYFANITGMAAGTAKQIVITNVFKASSNITVYVQTNLLWLGPTNDYAIGASPMHTNRAYPVTNVLVLSLQPIGSTSPSILSYGIPSSP